jgi:hypothetical protein
VFGEIVEVDPAGRTLTLALGQLFGAGGPDEATEAAREDGVIGPDEWMPNPWYIRDLHERRVLQLDPGAIVIVLGRDEEGNSLPMPIGLEAFVKDWESGPPSGDWESTPWYWCSLTDGRVVSMEAEHGP